MKICFGIKNNPLTDIAGLLCRIFSRLSDKNIINCLTWWNNHWIDDSCLTSKEQRNVVLMFNLTYFNGAWKIRRLLLVLLLLNFRIAFLSFVEITWKKFGSFPNCFTKVILFYCLISIRGKNIATTLLIVKSST